MTSASHALVTFQSKLLLLLRDNIPTISNPNRWGLLGGISENHETPLQTLLRELEEEALIKPKNIQFLLKLPGTEQYIYLVKLSEEEAKQIRLGNEGQKLAFFSLEELENIALSENLKFYLPKYKDTLKRILTF